MAKGHPQFDLTRFNDGANYRFAIIVAKWNQEINDEMLSGAQDAFKDYGIPGDNIDVFHVPGAYEIPFFANELAEEKDYNAMLALATVIRGDTYHFELVVNESNRAIMQVGLDHGVPIMNGILAVENETQAKVRADKSGDNKGYELAISAMDFVKTIESI